MEWGEEVEIEQALREANSRRFSTWELCRYTRDSGVLVLYGHEAELAQVGYLVFRGVKSVRLLWWIEGAHFSISSSAGDEEASDAPAEADNTAGYSVLIHSQDRAYRLTCQSITFYESAAGGQD